MKCFAVAGAGTTPAQTPSGRHEADRLRGDAPNANRGVGPHGGAGGGLEVLRSDAGALRVHPAGCKVVYDAMALVGYDWG